MTRSGIARSLLALVLVAALAVAGCGGGGNSSNSGSAKVPPKTYLNKVCGSLQDYFRALRASGADLQSSLSGKSQPAQGKQALTHFLDQAVSQTGQLLDNVRNAGVPAVKNGQQVETNLVRALQAAQRSFQQARTQAGNLPTGNKASFVKGTQQLAASLSRSGQAISAAFSKIRSPELERLAGKNPKCQAATAGG